MESYGLHWFRRDLRVLGNAALEWSVKEHRGRVLGLFCFDAKFLARPDFSPNRFAFFLDTLLALKNELRALGGDLLVLDQSPLDAYPRLFETLKKNGLPLPTTCSFNRDYEPFARTRDDLMKKILPEEWGVQPRTFRDHLIIEPWENYKNDQEKSFYQVYSPFAKNWFLKFSTDDVKERIQMQKKSLAYSRKRKVQSETKLPPLFSLTWKKLWGKKEALTDHLDQYRTANQKEVTVPIPDAGSLAAFQRLEEFKNHLEKYKDARDIPSVDGTSKMSMFLKNGSITTSQIVASLGLTELDYQTENSRTRYLKEIVWREFYYSILYHCPRVEKEAFLAKYKNVKWQDDKKLFQAWCEGMTGYPIVDAGMRQLNTTGWMHNRVRMIVASFLCKDLLINWQWGENYFMKMLLDGDLAPNNGGWQWAASTGCDPQPYFRIFNPLLQSQKFDPRGEYIRTYVPELGHLDNKEIHQPHLSGKKINYPKPIVIHADQKAKVLRLYKTAP